MNHEKHEMFKYPETAKIGRVQPKNKIYEKARATKAVRELFVRQVERVIVAYYLAPRSIHLNNKGGYSEIAIIDLTLKVQKCDSRIFSTIDRITPCPVFFRVYYEGECRYVVAFKRPAEDGTKKWVIGAYFQTEWADTNATEVPLPIALDMKSLYEQMMLSIMGSQPREEESLAELVQRLDRIRKKERELQVLKSKRRKEKQFNRKVEINSEIRTLSDELDKLL